MTLYELLVKIGLDTKEFESGLEETTETAEETSNELKKSFSKIGQVVAAAFTAKQIIDFGAKCLEMASNVEEMENKFNVVFAGMTDEVNQWAEDFASAIGRNSNTIKGYLADNQNMFVGMGMTREEGAKLSEQMVQLALDLASFNNMQESDAVNALSKALMGETEAAKQLGAVLNDNTIAMAMESMGYRQKFDTLTEAQKMQVRYTAILMQSEDAIGDCARSVDSFKGAQIRAQSATQNLMESIGKRLLPIATEFVSAFADGAAFLTANIDGVILAVEMLGAVVIGTLVGKGITKLVNAFQMANLQLALYTMQNGQAAIAQGIANGSFSLGEIVVGLLTGKITLAAAAQAAWNAVMNMNPIGLLISAVGILGIAISRTCNNVGVMNNEVSSMGKTANQVHMQLVQLRADRDAMAADTNTWWTQKKRLEYQGLCNDIAALEAEYERLRAEENAVVEDAEAHANTLLARVQPQITECVTGIGIAVGQFINETTRAFDTFASTYANLLSGIDGWFKPFDKASTGVRTNIRDMMSAMQSHIDFNEAYTENLKKLQEYGLGGLAESFQAYGADGAAYAAAIVSAVEKAGGATTDEGQKIIQGFADINQKVTSSEEELAQTMALMNGDIESELKSLGEIFTTAIEDLDKSSEAKTAAENTFGAFLSGIKSKVPDITREVTSLGKKMTDALKTGIGKVTINVDFVPRGIDGSNKDGLDYVPFDGYISELHKGEAVLTAAEAAVWRAGKESASNTTTVREESSGNGGGVTIQQYINVVPQTPVEFASATAAYFEQARWV